MKTPIISLIAVLVVMLFAVPAHGDQVVIWARDSLFGLSTPTTENWRVSTTATDEPIQTAFLGVSHVSSLTESWELDGIFTSDLPRVFGGHRALAVGLFNEAGDPQIFFQTRGAGSNATVLDDSLGAEFVDAGLWTDVDEYIEIELKFDGYWSLDDLTPDGPDSYEGFNIPEPSTFALALIGLLGIGITFRRNRRR